MARPKVSWLDNKMAVGTDVTEPFIEFNRCYPFRELIG
jgi:hypothetical protein